MWVSRAEEESVHYTHTHTHPLLSRPPLIPVWTAGPVPSGACSAPKLPVRWKDAVSGCERRPRLVTSRDARWLLICSNSLSACDCQLTAHSPWDTRSHAGAGDHLAGTHTDNTARKVVCVCVSSNLESSLGISITLKFYHFNAGMTLRFRPPKEKYNGVLLIFLF